jgi:hypothetical protein
VIAATATSSSESTRDCIAAPVVPLKLYRVSAASEGIDKILPPLSLSLLRSSRTSCGLSMNVETTSASFTTHHGVRIGPHALPGLAH